MSRELIIDRILSMEELEVSASREEWITASEFVSIKRRREWLSWRVYLRRRLGDVTVAYAPSGAPYIVGSDLRISVSHSKDYVALIISDEGDCAVDIESIARNFTNVESRYLTPREGEIMRVSSEPLALAIGWCAKEAAYKYASGERALELLHDITITQIDYTTQNLTIEMCGKRVSAQYSVGEDFVVVTI